MKPEAAIRRFLTFRILTIYFPNIHWRTPALESLFNKISGLKTYEYCEIFMNSSFYVTPLVATGYNISRLQNKIIDNL